MSKYVLLQIYLTHLPWWNFWRTPLMLGDWWRSEVIKTAEDAPDDLTHSWTPSETPLYTRMPLMDTEMTVPEGWLRNAVQAQNLSKTEHFPLISVPGRYASVCFFRNGNNYLRKFDWKWITGIENEYFYLEINTANEDTQENLIKYYFKALKNM